MTRANPNSARATLTNTSAGRYDGDIVRLARGNVVRNIHFDNAFRSSVFGINADGATDQSFRRFTLVSCGPDARIPSADLLLQPISYCEFLVPGSAPVSRPVDVEIEGNVILGREPALVRRRSQWRLKIQHRASTNGVLNVVIRNAVLKDPANSNIKLIDSANPINGTYNVTLRHSVLSNINTTGNDDAQIRYFAVQPTALRALHIALDDVSISGVGRGLGLTAPVPPGAQAANPNAIQSFRIFVEDSSFSDLTGEAIVWLQADTASSAHLPIRRSSISAAAPWGAADEIASSTMEIRATYPRAPIRRGSSGLSSRTLPSQTRGPHRRTQRSACTRTRTTGAVAHRASRPRQAPTSSSPRAAT